MTVVTRFAPSPTGFLHIGGGRTALFNWLFARHHGGKFLLRIEDTDRARSTPEAVEAIFDGIRWLGLDWDGEAVMQFARAGRHAEVARKLLAEGKAYLCYCSQDELAAIREDQRAKGLPMRYPGIWRDRDPSEAPAGVPGVVRLKAPGQGETIIADLVQGDVRVANDQLDDMVLLRADGTPTYMLSVVVDDHDMGITHVIRGDDHLTNAFRQYQLYKACGWDVPTFAHIPLIHGPDGAKLSKRHGALGVDAYRDMGFLPEAMRNYLLRLGWSHGDDEIISTEQAIAWFNLDSVGRSASRFDFVKLTQLNGHYLRQADDARLAALLVPMLESRLGRALAPVEGDRVRAGMAGLKDRAKTMVELADSALFYVTARPLALDDKAAKAMADPAARADLAEYAALAGALGEWSRQSLEDAARAFAEARGQKLGKIAQPLRAALAGSSVSPPIFEVMEVLGREESLGRIGDVTGQAPPSESTAA
ncbi:glutamate--tRNA ligase [Magnetospirillum sp. SS-4]|uniref:glutamate--tRNA ligase n=1 Tax=Magnetospirillum sp. SS-4 TaxID=2681465 RepID=UPI00137C4D01|nr:glutamate--tRNA ligase [Magnetospirillum sp. SS-4]CAA7627567.1 Glutamate--tRNA ligase 2 [Magnetospirillum sp. SS-4]